jgi:hypothetical protein
MALVLVGVVAVLIAALADPLGIGGTEAAFGWKQVALLAVGILLILGGAMVLRARGNGTGSTSAP